MHTDERPWKGPLGEPQEKHRDAKGQRNADQRRRDKTERCGSSRLAVLCAVQGCDEHARPRYAHQQVSHRQDERRPSAPQPQQRSSASEQRRKSEERRRDRQHRAYYVSLSGVIQDGAKPP